MRVAIIGRSEILYWTAKHLTQHGHEISLIVTSKEAPEYTKTADDFCKLAERNGAKFLRAVTPEKILDALRISETIDIAVSVNHNSILPQEVIDHFPLGILNAHGGDLPRYRGNACQAWALLNGEDRIGLCIHKMVGGELDNGNIIVRKYLDVNIDTKITDVMDWFIRTVPGLFLKALELLEKDSDYFLEEQSRNPKDIIRCYPRNASDGRICWEESSECILRLINASNRPYAGAYCSFDGHEVKIWHAKQETYGHICAIPGQVLEIGNGWVDVACGEGVLRLYEVERNGIQASPDQFVKSYRSRFLDGV